jgi:DNA-binding response OmpR family regulator
VTRLTIPGRASPPRILIVDDNRDVCEAVGAMLKHTGAETFLTFDGTGALDALEKSAIDLAIVDLLFAGPISSDLVVRHAQFRNCKVITMSGTLASDRRGRDLQHPHIVKPFGSHELVELVTATLAQKSHPSVLQ